MSFLRPDFIPHSANQSRCEFAATSSAWTGAWDKKHAVVDLATASQELDKAAARQGKEMLREIGAMVTGFDRPLNLVSGWSGTFQNSSLSKDKVGDKVGDKVADEVHGKVERQNT